MEIKIIEFSDEYAKYFTSLNVAWLEKYFVVEPMDHEMLSDPKNLSLIKAAIFFSRKRMMKLPEPLH
jgi:hypothetical protein